MLKEFLTHRKISDIFCSQNLLDDLQICRKLWFPEICKGKIQAIINSCKKTSKMIQNFNFSHLNKNLPRVNCDPLKTLPYSLLKVQ